MTHTRTFNTRQARTKHAATLPAGCSIRLYTNERGYVLSYTEPSSTGNNAR